MPELPGLRPSGDRVRETLFNWLAPWLPGSRCVDLFAGAGALGFEAASRGAAGVILVEFDRAVCRSLQHTVERLDAAEIVRVERSDALGWLDRCPDTFDVVFVDPPFTGADYECIVEAGAAVVSPSGWLYLEQPVAAPLPGVPGMEVHRTQRFGQVRGTLLRKTAQ